MTTVLLIAMYAAVFFFFLYHITTILKNRRERRESQVIVDVKVNNERCLMHMCCEDICPEVFTPADDLSSTIVKEDAKRHFTNLSKEIRKAAEACPTKAITLTEGTDRRGKDRRKATLPPHVGGSVIREQRRKTKRRENKE